LDVLPLQRSLPDWLRVRCLSRATLILSIFCLSRVGLLGASQASRTSSSVVNNPEAFLAKGVELIGRNRFADACRSFAHAAEIAHRSNETQLEAKAQRNLSGCRILIFDYRGAQVAAETARDLALKQNDRLTAGVAMVNLASVHSQLGDFLLADKEAEQATELLKDSPNKERLAKALLLYANIDAELTGGRMEAEHAANDAEAERRAISRIERNYRRGVEVAHAAGLAKLEANLWEELGESLLVARQPREAEEPLQKAYSIESADHDEDGLAVNREHQAELQLEKKNYQAGLRLIDQALASHSAYFRTTPIFYPLHTRGVLLLALNRKQEALAEFRKAVDFATEWRQGALPGDTTSTRTVVLLHDVYQDYAQVAADLSLEHHDPGLARQSLEVLAENRAASLREQIARALGQKLELPPRYFSLLSELQSAQARLTLGEGSQQDKAKLDQLRLELGSIENEFGLQSRNISRTAERNHPRDSLRDIQHRLSENELLLSFCLGKSNSFLWAVTASNVNLYRLESEHEIGSAARQFSQAVQKREQASALSRRLSQTLFGSLPPALWRKPDWLVVADGVLLDGIPFSALSDLSNTRSDTPLAETHDLRFLPGELLLVAPNPPKPQPRFVGVGDPLYNLADSRRIASLNAVSAHANRASSALSRLVGSDREVRTAAKQSGMAEAEILVGTQASIAGLRKAIAKQPEVLHFAVHVVTSNPVSGANPGQNLQTALALSLTPDNMPELLTPEAVATLRVPGSLVILSGCSSERGEILPGAGLMGLSRAWLLAGASAVVVSAWPTPDDSGRFFSAFYSHFEGHPSGTLARRAAWALDKAQIEMAHGGGYRSAPNFWAAYSVISKE
jgi:CHAT domain-containing protein